MIESKRLILVPFEEFNWVDIQKWISDPYYKFYFKNIPDCFTRQQFMNFPNQAGINCFMIYEKGHYQGAIDNNFVPEPIGLASWDNVRILPKTCDIGFIIDKNNEANKHYVKEGLYLLLDYLFNRLGFHKVGAITAVEAKDTSEKLCLTGGFKFEGVSRDHYFLEGKWHDENRYSILEHEFRTDEFKELYRNTLTGESLWEKAIAAEDSVKFRMVKN